MDIENKGLKDLDLTKTDDEIAKVVVAMMTQEALFLKDRATELQVKVSEFVADMDPQKRMDFMGLFLHELSNVISQYIAVLAMQYLNDPENWVKHMHLGAYHTLKRFAKEKEQAELISNETVH
jgi:hypothetical protein